MPGRIPQTFIDDLLNRIDIVEVIDARVPLKKAGREYQACCPFHNEKTPSFTVSPTKQFYHCFGCGAHGSAVGFMMDYDHLEFPEAIEELARSIGVEVPREDGNTPRQDPRRGDHYSLLERVDRFYRSQLREHPQAEQAVSYLKNRGLSGEIAATFGLGYAPPGWDNLLKFLANDTHSQQLALELGLLVQRDEGGFYDRFRDRIMFPIRDRRGRTIGFGGRVMGKDEKPKYMNSPESPVFHKGQELYGLFEARKASQKLERLLVVEGYMDVAALAQFGLTNAVATLGTATTPDHLERLYRTVREVVFCFDGDAAGSRAAWRALENALPAMRDGREARFLFLPEGEDPDSLIRSIGSAAFQKKTVESVPLSQFFFEHLQQQVDMESVDGRARLIELARPLMQTLPDAVFRDLMLDQLAERSGMDANERQNRVFSNETSLREEPPKPQTGHSGRSPVRAAIRLLLEQPQLAETVTTPCGFEDYDAPGIALLSKLLEILHQSPKLSTGGLIEYWRGQPEAQHLARLLSTPLDLPPEGLGEEFRDALQRLVEQRNGYRTELLLFQSRQQSLSGAEKNELKALLTARHPTNE